MNFRLEMLDFNALAVFIHVVEARSFTAAARRLDMPVSTVSRKVSDLERQLQRRLLERSTRRLRLTDAGAEIFERAKINLEGLEAAARQASDREAKLAGTLRLSAPPSLSDVLLAPIISRFQRRHPDVTVHCLVTERRIDFIADGVDVALQVDPDDRSRVVSTPLLSYRHLLLASPAYLAAHGEPRRPAELGEHRTIAFAGWPTGHRWVATDGRVKRNVDLTPSITINDYAGILELARSGHGIAEAPQICCAADLESGALRQVMAPWRLLPVTLSAAKLRRPFPSRLVDSFVELLVAEVPRRFSPLAE